MNKLIYKNYNYYLRYIIINLKVKEVGRLHSIVYSNLNPCIYTCRPVEKCEERQHFLTGVSYIRYRLQRGLYIILQIITAAA